MKMNKLIMSNNMLDLNNEEILLNNETDYNCFNINGTVVINEIINGEDNREIIININNESILLYNRFGTEINGTCKIIINSNNNSKIDLNYSFISSDKYKLIIENKVSKNENQNNINIHGVAINNAIIVIEATGIIEKNTFDNNYIEKIKILSLNEMKHTILPNLVVDSNEVNAIHNASISSINKNSLYYLKRLCLDEKSCIKLIRDGFLLNNLEINKEVYTKIKEILN